MYPVRVLSYLAKQGHTVKVFTFRYDQNLKEKEWLNGIEIRRINYDIKIIKGFLSFSYPFRIFQDISQSDLIIFNQPVFEGVFVILFAKILRKQVISLFNCEVDLGKGLKNRFVTCCLNMAVFVQLFFSDIIVAYTEDYARSNWLLKHFMKKLKFILPPIPKNRNSREKSSTLSQLKQAKKWICFCGRTSKEKGLEYFIRSYQYLEHRDNIVYVFAGPYGQDVAGEEHYYQKIKTELEVLSVPHIFLGSINNDELGALYHNIDCLVLPSVNKTESFGIVQVEAMLFGKPVIASNLPGVRVPVSLTGMGYLCEPGDSRDLAQKIDLVLDNNACITDEKCRHVETLFNTTQIYKAWEDLLHER